MKPLQNLFDDWFVFFLHRYEDPKFSWNMGNIMVSIPFIAAVLAIDFLYAAQTQSEPLLPKMNRWAMVLVLAFAGLLLGGMLSGRLRFSTVVAQRLSGHTKPTTARTVKNLLLWYVCPIALVLLTAVIHAQIT